MDTDHRGTRGRKRGEWLALAAALMLGTGFGALASAALGRIGVGALLVGCVTLVWALVERQRLEMEGWAEPAAWEAALSWGSWAALAGVGAAVFWNAAISG